MALSSTNNKLKIQVITEWNNGMGNLVGLKLLTSSEYKYRIIFTILEKKKLKGYQKML